MHIFEIPLGQNRLLEISFGRYVLRLDLFLSLDYPCLVIAAFSYALTLGIFDERDDFVFDMKEIEEYLNRK
jgi:hypothetical protein